MGERCRRDMAAPIENPFNIPEKVDGYGPEIATIEVSGKIFQDWETVWVQHRYGESESRFRFTTAERTPVPRIMELIQLMPGEIVVIRLGGVLAMIGMITVRQVGYDATNHSVMLMGKSVTWWAARSSVDTKTGSFDNKNIVQVAKEVLSKYTVGLKVIGKPDMRPFVELQNQPGETVWDFLERIARPKGVVLGSDHLGNFLLIGVHSGLVAAELIEGYNILSCNMTITNESKFQDYMLFAQKPGHDPSHGQEASEIKGQAKGTAPIYSNLITVAEQPVKDKDEADARAKNEADWHEYADIQGQITVYGWLRADGDLWRTGSDVSVFSPMIVFHGEALGIMTATFTQDSKSGTTTQLDLVRPGLLKDTISGSYADKKPANPAAVVDPAKLLTNPPPDEE